MEYTDEELVAWLVENEDCLDIEIAPRATYETEITIEAITARVPELTNEDFE